MDFDKLLVSTKFAPPHIGSRFIPRKHLLDQLRDGRRCSFVLVTGGAGFGKTILLAQWRLELMKAGDEVSWLSLSHDDKQLASFVAYLTAALRRLGIAVEDEMLLEGLEGLDGDIAKATDNVVAATLNAAAVIAKDLYLVIDDYHHVDDQRAHRLVQKLIDHCPANLHIAIASRAAPPLLLSRLRVLGRVTEIGFGELPFNADETRSFLAQNLGTVRLNAEEVRLIHDKTSGWPASLELMAIMLRSRPETRARLRELGWSSADLQAYLAEEVVAHLPPEMIDFMEQVSVCRRFNVELAEAVTGGNAAALIRRAEDENLLMYRVESDDRLPWYRFHPLFGEFLAARLERRGAAHVDALHRRASRWFAEHGLLGEAVRHAVWGGELEFAADAIDQAAKETWSLSFISLMLNLLDRLPQETLFAHPRLFFLGCLTLSMTARHAKAERWLAQIRESGAARNPAISSKLPLADAAVAMQRDDTQRCIDLLEPLHGIVSESPYLLHFYLCLLGYAYASVGRHADAYKLLDDNPIDPAERKNDIALVAEGSRALLLLTEGNVREAARIGGELVGVAESLHGRRSVSASVTAATLGESCYELDRLDEARELLANRARLVMQASMPPVMLSAALVTARLDLMHTSSEAVLTFLDAQAVHYQGLGLHRLVACMQSEQIRILLNIGQRARAGQVAARLNELGTSHRNADGVRAEIPAVAALARARMALAGNDPNEALLALQVARAHAQKYRHARMQVQENLLAAFALDELKRFDDTSARLVEAVQIASRFGLLRMLLDEGPRAGVLLAGVRGDARIDEAAAAHLEDLLARFGKAEGARPAPPLRSSAKVPEGVNLTPRELEILGLVAQAMTNKRIALTLNISLDTVKWNVRNILTKLDLSSRYDAMSWARKQGLIE
ncbi:LuxR C-terminal-related transcriptional regulator [Variovorax rhizosphaerae]|uniref:LuxR C-terminal-related transcriptional regulator n=1 Tax=Variovorax rhizosphaerae TaxID=1836200 RepID=A0ABU8WFW7_9BURK